MRAASPPVRRVPDICMLSWSMDNQALRLRIFARGAFLLLVSGPFLSLQAHGYERCKSGLGKLELRAYTFFSKANIHVWQHRVKDPSSKGYVRLRDYRLTPAVADQLWKLGNQHHQYEPKKADGYERRNLLDAEGGLHYSEVGTGYSEAEIQRAAEVQPTWVPHLLAFNKLAPVERAAIQIFTTQDTINPTFNRRLWNGSAVDSYKYLILPLASGLNGLPPLPGVSYSGVPAAGSFGVRDGEAYLSTFPRSGTYTTKGFISAARTLQGVYDTPVMFEIHGYSGRLIEPFSRSPEEQEVLFLPGTVFNIRAIEKRKFTGTRRADLFWLNNGNWDHEDKTVIILDEI